MAWWSWLSAKTTTSEKSSENKVERAKPDAHSVSAKNRACAHKCLDWTLYKPLNLLRHGGIALVSSWAGMMTFKYLTTSSDNPEFDKHYHDLTSSMMWMVTAGVINCGSNFLHKKPVIEGLEFTTKFFLFGSALEYTINGIRSEPNSFVDRLCNSAHNLTHNIL